MMMQNLVCVSPGCDCQTAISKTRRLMASVPAKPNVNSVVSCGASRGLWRPQFLSQVCIVRLNLPPNLLEIFFNLFQVVSIIDNIVSTWKQAKNFCDWEGHIRKK